MEQKSFKDIAITSAFPIIALSFGSEAGIKSLVDMNIDNPLVNIFAVTVNPDLYHSPSQFATGLNLVGFSVSEEDEDKVTQLLSHRPKLRRVLSDARSAINTFFGFDTPLTIEHFPADEGTNFDSFMVYIGETTADNFEEQMEKFNKFDSQWLAHNFDRADGKINFSLG